MVTSDHPSPDMSPGASSDISPVSVIIPTHNRKKVLLRALASVYVQRHPVAEVIVIDDGSTDGTASVVQQKYPQVTLISQVQHGVSHARNRGIDAAHGEWLAFLDSDDEWTPLKIELQLKALWVNPFYRICHSDEIWIRNGQRVNPMQKHRKHGGWIFEHCLPRCVLSPSSVILHRSVIEEYGNFDESLPVCEDYDLWLRLSTNLPVIYLPETLVVKYGGHPDQLSRKYWGMDRYRIQALEKLLASNNLTTIQKQQALGEIVQKIDIYLAGARRRQRKNEAKIYEDKRTFYNRLLTQTSAIAATPMMPIKEIQHCT